MRVCQEQLSADVPLAVAARWAGILVPSLHVAAVLPHWVDSGRGVLLQLH